MLRSLIRWIQVTSAKIMKLREGIFNHTISLLSTDVVITLNVTGFRSQSWKIQKF